MERDLYVWREHKGMIRGGVMVIGGEDTLVLHQSVSINAYGCGYGYGGFRIFPREDIGCMKLTV
jgi:hypothetical protein